MRHFTDTEYRQLLDMLDVESSSSKFSSIFTRALQFWREPATTLDNMRRGYNFFVVELLKNQGIKTDGIYNDFDDAWNKAIEHGKFEFIDDNHTGWWAWRIVNIPNPEVLLTHRVLRLRSMWRHYKELLRSLVEQRARLHINAQDES